DENFIMTYDQQKENAEYTQAYNQGLQLLLQGIIPQPGERYPEENYWAMMQIFNNNIANETTFGQHSNAHMLITKKVTNYFNKNKEIQFSDKKGITKPREWVVFNVYDRKYLKENFKGFTHMYRKGKPRTKEEKYKNKYTKKTPGRKKDYTKNRPQNKTKEYSKEEKEDAFARLLAARVAKFEKDKKKATQKETKTQDTFGEGKYPRRTKEVDEPMVFYTQKKYQEYQEYLKAKQAYLA
ncbi:1714_t:CDS:2, partial [Gigaspora margarita]